MVATSAPFGFKPSWHPSGQIRARALPGGISAAYANSIYSNQPVALTTAGVLNEITGTGVDFVGVFAGVEYTPTGGRPTVSPNWPGGTSFVAGSLVAYYYEDPLIQYMVQADGSLAQTSIGDQANITNFTANALGYSQATLSSSLAGAGSQAQWRIESLVPDPAPSGPNAWGDAYTVVLVSIARHQYISNKVAI